MYAFESSQTYAMFATCATYSNPAKFLSSIDLPDESALSLIMNSNNSHKHDNNESGEVIRYVQS